MNIARLCLLALAISVAPLKSWAQGTITDGDVSLSVSGFGTSGMFLTTGGFGETDQLFAAGYWFRTGADTQEYAITSSSPDSESYVGNIATLTWNNAGDRGLFGAEVVIRVQDSGDGRAQVITTLEIIVLDGISSADVFFYADPDLDFGASNDSAEFFIVSQEDFTAPAFHVFDDSCMDITAISLNDDPVEISAADAWQVAPFAALANSLNDAAITDLDNSGLPFGPGDFTGAFQFEDQPLNLQWFGILDYTPAGQVRGANDELCGEPETVPVPGPGPIPLGILMLLMIGAAWQARSRLI